MVLELVQVVAQQINVLHVELVVSKLHVYQLLKDRFKNTLENSFSISGFCKTVHCHPRNVHYPMTYFAVFLKT